jgi:hypothetical protein
LSPLCSNGGMCTAVLSVEPGAPVLLAGIRDEFADRAWQPPGQHWPEYPGLIGGLDLLAGGTWLAVAPAARRVACVLNGRGRMAPAAARRSRGVLPLQAAAEGKLERAGIADFDPFHLLSVEPGMAVLWSWDGERLTDRELTAGLHFVVNSGLDIDRPSGDAQGPEDAEDPDGVQGPDGQASRESTARAYELARIAHFRPLLRAAVRPVPLPGSPVRQAWGAWLPLIDGDGIGRDDQRALIVRHDLGGGRIWGTTSASLVALSADWLRFDFTGRPGDQAGWYPVPLAGVPL